MKNIVKGVAVFCFVSLISISNALANDHEPPFVSGHYWEVTGVKLSDGAGLKYSKWLADEWRKNLNFGKSEGWLERFEVLSNVHPRPDEPDLYLIVVFKNMTTPDQDEERRKKYMEWAKKSMEKMYAESADRAEYRTVMGTKLLQELKFRK